VQGFGYRTSILSTGESGFFVTEKSWIVMGQIKKIEFILAISFIIPATAWLLNKYRIFFEAGMMIYDVLTTQVYDSGISFKNDLNSACFCLFEATVHACCGPIS
jgi:hypothetical protein